MSTNKHINLICVAVMIFALVLTVVFMCGESLGIRVMTDEDAQGSTTAFTAKDENADWDRNGATVIRLQGKSGTVTGDGAYFLNGSLYITKAGDYRIAGELSGSIIVKASKKAKVRIALEGVNVDGGDSAAFLVQAAEKVFLTLDGGTENVFTSGDSYSDKAIEDGIDGAFFTKSNLTINGTGSLIVEAPYRHGIVSDGNLVVTGGNIRVTANKDAIHIKNNFRFKNALLLINAGDDAIHADADALICGGSILVEDCYEGIEASNVLIEDGDIIIYCKDDGINACSTEDSKNEGGRAEFSIYYRDKSGDMPGTNRVERYDDNRQPDGGKNSENEDFNPGWKRPEEQNGMPGMQREWPEGQNGMPGMRGEKPDAQGEMPGFTDKQDRVNGEELSLPCVTISGGTVSIYNSTGRDADGIDSNGDIYITGGTVLVSMVGSGGNYALDFGTENGGKCVIDGGTVIAAGGSGMLEAVSEESKQCVLTYVGSSVAGDQELVMTNKQGEELMRAILPNEYSAVTLSCAGMQQGDIVTLRTGEEERDVELTQKILQIGASGTSGGFGPGRPGGKWNR